MSRKFDNEDYGRAGYDGAEEGYGYTRPGSGKDGKDFSTVKLVGEDGTFFGMKVSPQVAGQLNAFSQPFNLMLSRWAEKEVAPLFERLVKQNNPGINPHVAIKAGERAANVVGYAILLNRQIEEVLSNVYHTGKAMNELRAAVTPVIKGSSRHATIEAIFGDGNNEVIHDARNKINSLFWQRLLQTGVGAIATIPNLIFKHQEMEKKRVETRRENLVKRYLKGEATSEEIAAAFESEMRASGMGPEMEAAREELFGKVLGNARTKYEAGFKAFEAEKGAAIRKEVLAEVGHSYTSTTATENGGHATIDSDYAHARRKYEIPERFYGDNPDKAYKNAVDKAVKRKIRSEYMKTSAARGKPFDADWAEDWGFGKERRYGYGRQEVPKTHQQELEERFSKTSDEIFGISKDGKQKHKEGEEERLFGGMTMREGMYSLGAGLGADVVRNFVGGNFDKYKKPTALDRILHLRNVLAKAEAEDTNKKDDDLGLEVIPGIALAGGDSEPEMSFTKYVHSIFMTHQESRSAINHRFFTHLEHAHWDDAALQAASKEERAEWTPYEEAVVQIATKLKQGALDPLALITLVGDRSQKIVRDSGKAFGPKGLQGKDDQVKAAINRSIEEQVVKFRPDRKMSEEQVAEAMGELPFTEEELKQALGPNGLKGEERAFFFTLVDMLVPDTKVLCAKAGLDEKTCEALRKEAQARFGKRLSAAVEELVQALEEHPEQLSSLKLSDEEKEQLSGLVAKAEEAGQDVPDVADKKELRTAEAAVAGAIISETKEGAQKEGGGFFQRLVSRSLKPREEKAASEKGDSLQDELLADARGGDDGEKFASRHKPRKKKGKEMSFEDAMQEERDRDDDVESPNWSEHEESASSKRFSNEDFEPAFAKRSEKSNEHSETRVR